MRAIGTIVVLLGLWLLLSGVYKPLVIGFGVASVLIVVFVVNRMDSVDEDRVPLEVNYLQMAKYFVWLLGEIAKANWAVTKIVLSPKMPIRQHLFRTGYTQRSDLAQVIFANSITLTPGTISVETEPGQFLVHALAYSPADLDALKDMDQRVSAIESKAAH